jgi:hypothetical protein
MLDRFRTELIQVRPLPNRIANVSPISNQRNTQTWERWREHSVASTARRLMSLRKDAVAMADQYRVSGINLPPPEEMRSDTPIPAPEHSWEYTKRPGCSRQHHGELARRRQLEPLRLWASVLRLLSLKP